MKQRKKIGKRIVAFILALMLLASTDSLANVQLAAASANIANVFYRLGKDVVTGERLVRPTILFQWQDPQAWAPATGTGFDQGADDPKGYRIHLENITHKQTQTYQVGYNKTSKHESEVADHLNLMTGSLYKVSVRPYHEHYNPNTGAITEAAYTGTDPFAYALTDLDVRLESTDNTISVIWDDLGEPDFTYRIVYALGDYSNEGATQTFYNNREGEVKGLSRDSDGVVKFYDKASRRNKLKYVLKEKIYPGQIYSIMIEPTVDVYKGEKVHRNRNYALIHSVSTNVRLNYTEEGEYLRLQWKIPASFEVGKSKDKYTLATTQLVEIVDENERNIAIFHKEAGAVNYYMVKKPKTSTSYQLKLTYKVGSNDSKPPIQAVSNVLVYSPTELKITPTKPVISKLTTQDMLDEWKLADMTPDAIKAKLTKEGYLLSGYDYVGDLAKIFNKNVVFYRNKATNSINLVWSAFRRKDIDITSPTYNRLISDLNTLYDISITDDFNALSEVPTLEKDLRMDGAAETDLLKNSSGDIIGFRKPFRTYYDNQKKSFAPFKPNKIYYIKLVAKKKVGNEELKSAPTIAGFYYDELGIYAPPTLTKPPLRELKERTAKDSAVIGWRERWYEVADIKNPDKASEWYPVMWIKGNEITSVEQEGATKYEVYKSEKEALQFIKAVEQNTNYKFVWRMVDMGKNAHAGSEIAYRFAAISYEEVLKAIEKKQVELANPNYDFAMYFDDLIDRDKKGVQPLPWNSIKPEKNTENQEELLYKEAGLKPNTSYLFILQPYRTMEGGNDVFAHFPTSILISTKPEEDILNPDPTVPKLFVVDSTDTGIKLGWTYNKDFTYKIKYTPTVSGKEEVELAVEVSDNPEDANYPHNGEFFFYEVKGLFPETSYNFSIQAENAVSGKQSDWSNPVIGRTKPIMPPPAPPGFGLASEKDMQRYNQPKAIGKDFFALQWMKLNEDNDKNKEDKVLSKTYDYIVEVTDNEAFIDPVVVNTTEGKKDKIEVLEKTLVKVSGLVPGKTYYARAKTRLTVKSGSLSLTVDSAEYTHVVKVTTGLNPDEYDGDKNPNLEILPDKDFELVYNEKDKSLLYRFRYNQKDQSGKADNRVDQRLINELIQKGVYVYTADISKFKNKPVNKRSLELPYPIYEAMRKHKVELRILADEMEIKMPMTAFEKEVEHQKKSFGAMPTILLRIDKSEQKPVDNSGQSLRAISSAVQMSASVESRQKKTGLAFLSAPVEMAMRPLDRSEAYNRNIFGYVQNEHKQQKQTTGNYDKEANRYRFHTTEMGVYGLYSGREALGTTKANSHWSEPYRRKVVAQMSFIGLESYSPNKQVSAQAFYNAVYAGVTDAKEIDFGADIAGDKKRTLVNSGMMSANTYLDGNISRMNAFTAFVKSYEMLTDDKLSYQSARVSQVAKRHKISQVEAITLLKAESAGLLSDVNQANPKQTLKYGEFFTVFSKVKGW